jgi:hypothetical protein
MNENGNLPIELIPDGPTTSTTFRSILMRRAEQEALERAHQWVDRDPFYEGVPLNDREKALMALAVRCLTQPTFTDIALLAMPARRPQ